MKARSLFWLLAVGPLLTGCPHNDYTVELVPKGAAIQRTLTLFRTDGADTNGQPQYQSFPSNELASISRLYESGQVRREGERHILTGTFGGLLPKDISDSGFFTNVTTSLGSSTFYIERFRGSDDLAARVEGKFAAADQLADLVIGWSAQEFANEPHYERLQQFLKTDFRRDLKNLSLYAWVGEIASSYQTNAGQEFLVRCGQYLVERDYVRFTDLPALIASAEANGDLAAAKLFQRFAANKLGQQPGEKLPDSLSIFEKPASLQASWSRYLAGTELYRAALQRWEKEKGGNAGTNPPEPIAVVNDLINPLMNINPGPDDHLAVKLTLPAAPVYSNGQWDSTRHQLLWTSDFDSRLESSRLPQLCFAVWSNPAEDFQKAHFGRVILTGEQLVHYCSWQASLERQQTEEWERFLKSFTPVADLKQKLEAFAPDKSSATWPSVGRDLLKAALMEKTISGSAAAH